MLLKDLESPAIEKIIFLPSDIFLCFGSKNNYFKDRKKIGVVIKNVNHLKKAINFLDNNKVNFKKKIAKTRANRIEHFKNSKQIMFVEINKIINNL